MAFHITQFTDNSDKVKEALEQQMAAALEAMGLLAEGYAKTNITARPQNPDSWYTRTGMLRNSITHQVKDKTAYIGTNVEYAPYVEFGTGPKAEGTTADGKVITGRQDVPWKFKAKSDGQWHISYGIAPSHFLKNAVADHKDEYIKIAEQHMKEG